MFGQAADAFFPDSGEENKHHNTATPAPPVLFFDMAAKFEFVKYSNWRSIFTALYKFQCH